MMAQTGIESRPGDRKLGDEWNDWQGERDPGESSIDEAPKTFLALASAVLLVFFVLLLFGWFLVEPRFAQFDPSLAAAARLVLAAGIVGAVLAIVVDGVLLLTRGRSFLPYAWTEKLLLSLLPRAIWLGNRFGISKDRIGNSFLKLHNRVTRQYLDTRKPGKLLVLLPRCLKKEARADLTRRMSSGEDLKICTVAGGEEARKAIMEYRPGRILAIACERDLMSGIKDVADRVPVLAVPNKRPEGPCKNTEFDCAELEEALEALKIKHADRV